MAASLGLNGSQRLDTQKWAAGQAEIATRMSQDLDALKASMVDLQKNLSSFAATGFPKATEASTAFVATQPELPGDHSLEPLAEPASKSFVTSSSIEMVLPDGSTGLAVARKSTRKTKHRIFETFATAVGETDFIGAVDYADVITLLNHMVRQHDIREQDRRNARLSAMHCLGIEPVRTGFLARVVQSRWFQQLVATVIILNSVFIGYAMEVSIREPGQETKRHVQWIERAFLVFFSMELVARLGVHRLHFFVNHDWQWNAVDLLLVVLSIQDLLFRQDSLTAGSGPRITFVRILRLSRVTRMFRIFRVMLCFRELRILWRCMSGSIRSMFWSIVMMAMFYYVFAIVFLNGVASHVESNTSEDNDDVLDVCGDVFVCMQTLYKASTGGADWQDLAEPLRKVGDFYYGAFLFFIAFALIAVLNVVTGIFVNDAIQASKGDAQESILAYMGEEKVLEETLRTIFADMDVRGAGSLSCDDFCTHMQDGARWAYFSTLGLNIGVAKEFFSLLCEYVQEKELSENGFVYACRRFRATAKYSDITLLRSHLSAIERQLIGLHDRLPAVHGQEANSEDEKMPMRQANPSGARNGDRQAFVEDSGSVEVHSL